MTAMENDDASMQDVFSSDNATPDPFTEEPASPPPREWSSDALPGDDVHDTLSNSALVVAPGTQLWRVVPHRASRKELPMLGFPSPAEHPTWYESEEAALEAALQLAVHLRDVRPGDFDRKCGPALFVGVCGPFSSKKIGCRAVIAHRAIDRSIRHEVSCVVSNARTREPHVTTRTPTQGSHESFAARFPGGVIPWQKIADDIARRNGTFDEHGLRLPAIEAEPPAIEKTMTNASGGVRLQLGGRAGSRGAASPGSLRTVTDKSAEDPEHARKREAGRRILVEGRVAAASAMSCE